MPEVAGDAALLVNPESVDAIAHAMSKIVGDRNLCDELVSRGRRRRELFTWDITASRLWQSMMATVGSNGNSQSSS